MENRTAGIIEGTRKHIRKKSSNSRAQNQAGKQSQMQNQGQTQMQTDLEIQLKASRDVRWQLYFVGSYGGGMFAFACVGFLYSCNLPLLKAY